MNLATPIIYNGREIPGYGVCRKSGTVYSIKQKAGQLMIVKKAVYMGAHGYPENTLQVDGKSKTFLTHKVVHETLNPNIRKVKTRKSWAADLGFTEKEWKVTPKNVKIALLRQVLQVNHIDHNKENFNPKNLEWVTRQENVEKYHEHREANNE